MAYNNELNQRIIKAVARWNNIASKKMFGGVCYLLNGNMFCGIQNDALIVRLGKTAAEQALRQSHVNPFSPTGRPMKDWVLVEQPAVQSDTDLKKWLDQARRFTQTLPAK